MDNEQQIHYTNTEECYSTSPLVYSFRYSPSLNQEHLNSIIETEDVIRILEQTDESYVNNSIIGVENNRNTAAEFSFEKLSPIGTTCCGKVEIKPGVFNTYFYETQNSGNENKLIAYRRMFGFDIYKLEGNDEVYTASLKANILGTKYILLHKFSTPIKIEYKTSLFKRLGPRTFSVSFLGTSGLRNNSEIILKNKEPYYNSETNSYSLNFNGRVTTPSVKNFQLIHPLEPTYVTLTFGKISKSKYILDYTHPWSGIQAFAVALAALDYKIGCD